MSVRHRRSQPARLPVDAEVAVARLDKELNTVSRPDWLEFKLRLKRRLDSLPVDQVAGAAKDMLRDLRRADVVHGLPPAA